MALGPIDMVGGMPPQSQGGRPLNAALLDARIERLLQMLNRADLTPEQRENTLRALTALQRERTLLQAFRQSESPPLSSTRREAPLTGTGREAGSMPTPQRQPAPRVTQGEHSRRLSTMANVERALEMKTGGDKVFSSLGKPTQQVDPLRSPLDNQVVVASQFLLPAESEEAPLPAIPALTPNPPLVLGFIPAQWIPGSVRVQARSPASLLLIGIVVLLLAILLVW